MYVRTFICVSSNNAPEVDYSAGGQATRPVSQKTSLQSHIRAKPMLPFQVSDYRLCMHITNGRRCVYGDACTFAHTKEELECWNEELRMSRNRYVAIPFNTIR